jgi:hypothetical protein
MSRRRGRTHRRKSREVERDGDQQKRQEYAQDVARQDRCQQRAQHGAKKGYRSERQLLAQVDMALGGVADGGRARAEQRLQLVGAERFERRQASKQQCWNGDEPAAAGDGIDEAGDERRGDQYQQGFCGYVEHRR